MPKVCPNPKCKSPYWDREYSRPDILNPEGKKGRKAKKEKI